MTKRIEDPARWRAPGSGKLLSAAKHERLFK
jgi:hypothetical protein